MVKKGTKFIEILKQSGLYFLSFYFALGGNYVPPKDLRKLYCYFSKC